MKTSILFICFFIITIIPLESLAENKTVTSFSKAKDILQNKIYFDQRLTLYCNAEFSPNKTVLVPKGFVTNKYIKRTQKIEWEHVVPAQKFGIAFKEWTDGHENCMTSKGKKIKGRKCAVKTNSKFRYMLSDMYNLFPAIGSVNAVRSNYNFVILEDDMESDFGSCDMRINNKQAQPPESSRGRIARAYLYMNYTYEEFNMSFETLKIMLNWHEKYPVSEWECLRASRIKSIQGNEHMIYKEQC